MIRLWILPLALAACSLDVSYTGTNYQCNADGTCPTNFVCESKQCVPIDPAPPACSKAVATGEQHACAIRNDGTVWCWGANDLGQLGNGTATDSTVPVQVQMLKNAVAIGTGGSSSCALDKTGAVWCWGHNDVGELGDGTNSDSRTPVQVKNVSGATAIAVGSEHACAVGADGTVMCWGSNDHGELGDGTNSDRNTPFAVPGLPPASAISTGDDTTCAVEGSTGTLRCWGLNDSGQIGDGTMNDVKAPTPVMMLPAVAGVAAGAEFTCANDAAGAVWCWGDNENAELGNGQQGGGSMLPVQVLNAVPLHELVAGDNSACGRDDQKRLWCWGLDYDARLGDGTTDLYVTVPRQSLMTNAVSMGTGGEATCAVDTKGAVRCSGFNRRGQLGNGQRVTQGAPQPVAGIKNAMSIATGGGHTCAALADGSVKCWGGNDSGQLGNGTQLLSALPADVIGIGNVSKLVAGGDHTCALSDGNVFCWGADGDGQLGTQTSFDSSVPLYMGELGSMPDSLSLGDTTTCVVRGGEALCIGNMYNPTITVAGGFSDVSEVAVGRAHTCVLRTTGAVECWGNDTYGQLGDGTTGTGTGTPQAVPNLSSPMHLYARYNDTCVLQSDGSAKCWGWNENYRVGNNPSSYDVTTPVSVQALAGAQALAVGFDASCAKKSDGSVWCWGPGYLGEVGDGQYTSRSMAVQVPGLSGVQQVVTGGSHACALLGDGSVSCWGEDDVGQLGDGVYSLVHPVGVQMQCP